jgi:predicted nucleotidyltransferase
MTFDIAAARQNLQARAERKRLEREIRRAQASQAITQAVRQVVTRFPNIWRVYLFGSVTRPAAFRQDSDIDVAIDGLAAADYFPFWRALEEAAPTWVIDVRDLAASSDFAERVRANGTLIYER